MKRKMTEDQVTQLPVPDGTKELRYTAKDATPTEAKLVAAVEHAKAAYETALGRIGMAQEARKRRGQRIQSIAEQKARSKASEVYRTVYTAEKALADFQAQAKDALTPAQCEAELKTAQRNGDVEEIRAWRGALEAAKAWAAVQSTPRSKAKDIEETYTAPGHKFKSSSKYKGGNGPCAQCGASFFATVHASNEANARLQELRSKLQAKAKDGVLSTPLMGLAALIALLSYFGHTPTVGPEDYDLARYRPKRRDW